MAKRCATAGGTFCLTNKEAQRTLCRDPVCACCAFPVVRRINGGGVLFITIIGKMQDNVKENVGNPRDPEASKTGKSRQAFCAETPVIRCRK